VRLGRLGRWGTVAGTAVGLVAAASTVQAVAQDQPAPPAGPVAVQSADVRVHTVPVSASVSRSKTATVQCPDGRKVYGGGARVIGGGGRVSLTSLIPRNTSSGGSYQAKAAVAPYYEHTQAWSLEVYAVCGAALPGYQIVTRSATAPEPTVHVEVRADCPSGTKLLGTGARVFGSGQGFLGAVKPFGETGLTAAATHDLFAPESDPATIFGVDAIAVCAQPPLGYDVVWTTASSGEPVRELTVTQPCPAGTSAYGVGFSRFAGAGHTRVDRAFPVADSTGRPISARIHAEQPSIPPGTSWNIHRAAICAA
jgi:hypothetical protein